MNRLENFYFNGYLISKFKPSLLLEQFNNTLARIFNGDLRDGYNLESKYPFSRDLRPQVYDYDSSIIDILFESNIPNLIKDVLGYNLHLAHVQLRIAELFPPGQENRSYMEWHRDTHFYNDQLVGNAPPTYKLIYYPKLNDTTEMLLMAAPGTHLKIFSNMKQDFQQLQTSEIIRMKASLDEFLFFNTAMFHSTMPAHKNGTIRIIYNFCLESQLSNYKEQGKLHTLYGEKLKGKEQE